MKEVRYFYVPDADSQHELPSDEATHALRVLRLKEGDEIFLQDGKGSFFRAIISITNAKHCFYEIVETLPQQRPWQRHIHLAIAPTKNIDRMEWLAEKATEVGFDDLSFLDCQFSERRQLRDDRIEKIVIAAMKQSRKAWKPQVNPLQSFKSFINTPRSGRLFIAHCYEEIERKELFQELSAAPAVDVTILVGPEGDFSLDEVRQAIANGYESVSLGSSRLRTETAGLVAVVMSQVSDKR